MSRQPLMLQLKDQGLSNHEIARRLRVTEAFVVRELAYYGVQEPTKPHGNRTVYQRKALEAVLQRKQRDAVAIANDITRLKEQIDQLSALEQSRRTLHQAMKGR